MKFFVRLSKRKFMIAKLRLKKMNLEMYNGKIQINCLKKDFME